MCNKISHYLISSNYLFTPFHPIFFPFLKEKKISPLIIFLFSRFYGIGYLINLIKRLNGKGIINPINQKTRLSIKKIFYFIFFILIGTKTSNKKVKRIPEHP